jgi:sugar (glycoside-pentoside-hexuronide) transporter
MKMTTETSKATATENKTYYKGAKAVGTKLAFASGEMVYNLPWMLVSSFLMFFMTDIALVPTLTVSALFLVVRVFDAVNDPLIGSLADRTKSKMGRYRPWMLVGAIILIPTVMLLFWAHPDWSEGSRTAYYCILYCVAVVGATMWNIPYGGLNASITPYPNERASFSSYRIAISAIACALASGLFLPLMNNFSGPDGTDVGNGYVMAAVIVCAIAIPFVFTSIGGTKEVVKPPKDQKIKFKALIKNIGMNPPLIIVIIGFFIYGFMAYGRMTSAMYYFSYVWGDANLFTIYNLVNGLITGAAAFFGVHLLRVFKNKRNTILFGYIGMLILSLVLFFMTPENSSSTSILTLLIISGAFQGIVTAIIYGMVPDTVEYGHWKSGIRADGFVYSGTSFMLKLGGAISPTLLGVLLAGAGYAPNVAQGPEALNMMNIMMNMMPAILCAIGFVAFLFYKLDNKMHAKIVQELEDRGEYFVE